MTTQRDPITDVCNAAFQWWCYKRPLSMTLVQHLKNPTINCTTERERNLAQAIADKVQTDATRKRNAKGRK